MAAEYEVNIKINSQQVTRQLGDIDQAISRISKTASNVGKPKGGSSRRKPGIAGLLPSSEELKAAERGLVQLTVKTKNLQNIAAKAKDLQSVQAKFSERRLRSLNRSNTLNEKELRLSQRLTSEARTRLRLLSQSGAKGFDAPRPQGRQMAESINALTNVQDKRARLLNKINEMEAKGLNVQKLRKQLGKATTEQAARRFGSAEKEFRILEKTLRLEQSKLRILKEQQKGFAASPVRGTPTMMGSPAQIAAAARAGGATSPIRGGLDFPGSPAFLAGATASRTPFGPSFPTGGAALPVRGSTAIPGSPKAIQAAKATNLRAVEVEASWSKTLKGLQDNAKVLELQGVNTQTSWNKALGGLQDNAKVLKLSGVNTQTSWGKALTGLQDNAKVLKLSGVNTQTSWGKALGELQETAGILKLKDARIKQSWNIALQELQETAGMLKMKDARIKQSWAKALSELEETAKDISENRGIQGRKRRRSRLEQVGLGAGFPLLFGGGAASVIGGGLGGLTGSFGAQIFFSAIGQQIDAFFKGVSEAATTVASSLDGTTETLEALGEAGIFVEQSLIDQVQSLEDAGRAVIAYDTVQKELTATYGESGLRALQTLKAANEDANKSTSELNAALQKELAPTFTMIADLSGLVASGLAKLVPILNALLNPFQGTPDPARARQVAAQGRIDAGVRQRAAQLTTGQTLAELSGDTASLQRQTEIAQLSNDLTNDRVVLLKEVEIIEKATSQIDALNAETQANLLDINLRQVNAAKIKKIKAQQALDLVNLEVDVSNAVARATEEATREQENRIDIAARERQKNIDLEASFQKRITAIGNETALLRGQIDGNEELVRKQIEINSLVERFGEDKRAQVELFVNEKFQLADQVKLLQQQERAAEQAKNARMGEEARLQKRLANLDEERQKIIEISRFKDQIAAAELLGDTQLAIRLQGQQKLAEIEASRKQALIGVTDQHEVEAINITKATEKLAAHRDTERELAELQRQRQEKFETTIENLDHQLALARATTEEERERLRIEEAIRKLREDDKLSEPQLDAVKSRMEALAEENNLVNTFIRETQEQIEKLNDPMFQAISLATTLGDAFSQSFRGIVDGSMSAQQALANLFQRTADHFLDMAAQMIAAQVKMQAVNLFMSFFPSSFTPLPGSAPQMKPGAVVTPTGFQGQFDGFAANGGPVTGGKSYIVGERGPELFTPGVSGGITPNHALGGANVTVNVDASGSSVEGDADQASQLGKAIGIAVQAELIKQKRPGGLLS